MINQTDHNTLTLETQSGASSYLYSTRGEVPVIQCFLKPHVKLIVPLYVCHHVSIRTYQFTQHVGNAYINAQFALKTARRAASELCICKECSGGVGCWN